MIGLLLVIFGGVLMLVGISKYIDYQRERASTPIDVEADS